MEGKLAIEILVLTIEMKKRYLESFKDYKARLAKDMIKQRGSLSKTTEGDAGENP